MGWLTAMSRPTVLISGGGIAGPAPAFWLHAAGFETTLVERAPSQRRGGFVIDFWGLGYDLAERMGLAEIVRTGASANALPPNKIVVHGWTRESRGGAKRSYG
jgi:2-polyprenyl-6-methoxyphenol hydroxylase-like FAD-dependent oxidoreductase